MGGVCVCWGGGYTVYLAPLVLMQILMSENPAILVSMLLL